MIHSHAATLCILLSLAHPMAMARDLDEANKPSREELDANFGPAEQQAMNARFSDKIPDTTSGAVTPSRLAAAAELVVVGTVEQIIFTHEGEYNQPFTNTTLRISKVLKGEISGDELTLKQQGGPSLDGQTVNIVSHTEHFQRGAEEILFLVREKDQWHIMKRFGIDEGLLYDPDGFGITMSEDGALGLTEERNRDPRFSTIDVGVDVLTKHFSDSSEGEPDYVDGNAVERATLAKQEPVKVDQFISAVQTR